MIDIDGSYCEGGGQIVRTALALSAVTGKAFTVKSIRKGRCSGGLKAQHITCVKAVAELCGAEVEGAEQGSERLTFTPGPMKAKNLDIEIGTAGSITLLMQSLLLPTILCKKRMTIRVTGGTDVKWSMPIDYFSEILLPQLRRYADIDFKLRSRGYYPKGGGNVELKVKGKYSLEEEGPRIETLEQGKLIQIKGVSHASASLIDAQVAERQAKAATLHLSRMDCHVDVRTEYHETSSAGSGVTLWSIHSKDEGEIDIMNPIRIGSDSLGERGKKAEKVGEEAALRLMNEIDYGAPIDEYLADNLIPFLGVFGGSMKVAKISNHTLTNIYTVEQFLDVKFDVDRENNTINI